MDVRTHLTHIDNDLSCCPTGVDCIALTEPPKTFADVFAPHQQQNHPGEQPGPVAAIVDGVLE